MSAKCHYQTLQLGGGGRLRPRLRSDHRVNWQNVVDLENRMIQVQITLVASPRNQP
jgi:hypothetical protein